MLVIGVEVEVVLVVRVLVATAQAPVGIELTGRAGGVFPAVGLAAFFLGPAVGVHQPVGAEVITVGVGLSKICDAWARVNTATKHLAFG